MVIAAVDAFDDAEGTISVDVVFSGAGCKDDVVIDMIAVEELDPVNKVNVASEVILVVVGKLVFKPLAKYVEGEFEVLVETLEFLLNRKLDRKLIYNITISCSK